MVHLFTNFAAACDAGSILSFPTWYKYLNPIADLNGGCTFQITGINDVWLIVAAIIEILLRVAGIFAVGFIMYGGFQYLTSQAEPDKVLKARQTIVSALIGLAIAILASVIVNFIAGSVK